MDAYSLDQFRVFVAVADEGGFAPTARRQKSLPFFRRQTLNRIAQHGARHDRRMGLQKTFQRRQMSFADLAQHPAHGLVNQIFFVCQQQPADLQRVGKVVLPNKVLRGHDRDPPLPKKF